jgi:UDP-glucose 4-epimerase
MGSVGQMRCALVGGGGFIGIHLSRALSAKGVEVRALGRSHVRPAALPDTVTWCPGDFRDPETLIPFLKGAEIVYHLASTSTPNLAEKDPAGDAEANVIGTLRLLDAAVRERVRRIIFISSGGTVYGVPTTVPIPEDAPTEPISAYGIHKVTIEKYLRLYHRRGGLESIVLRVANPFGPLQTARNSQGVVASFIERALGNEPLEIWGTGDVVRDFVYIEDVIEALVTAAEYRGPHNTFNVGSGQGVAVKDIVSDLEEVLGRGSLHKLHHPARAVDVPVNVLDVSRIMSEMGWQPRTSWKDGLRKTVAWALEGRT